MTVDIILLKCSRFLTLLCVIISLFDICVSSHILSVYNLFVATLFMLFYNFSIRPIRLIFMSLCGCPVCPFFVLKDSLR
jgi:hypothetical protein